MPTTALVCCTDNAIVSPTILDVMRMSFQILILPKPCYHLHLKTSIVEMIYNQNYKQTRTIVIVVFVVDGDDDNG